ncbi:MAG: hypothetical protein D6715_10130 [Calditrichaeota bacterium]|nr:MAG: hypothetical protein D6715_10130 [Calditrichota bacterium]
MPLVKIDNVELEVPAGTTVLEAAKQANIEIPHYCYHPGLKIVASCRMCLVKIEGMPKLVPSCSTRIMEARPDRKVDGKYDMVVHYQVPEVKEAQESVLEFLLLHHPVDCPECDQAGECFLQDYTYRYGKDHSRFEFHKRVPPRKDLGPNMLLVSTRCILCSRCVRFTDEVTGTGELVVKNRGYRSEIDMFPETSLNNKLSMCTADICPVGALVTKDFLFKPRNWRYKKVRSVCPGCSVGCNMTIEYMEEDNSIYRIKPVYNAEVNQWWMCDDGRLLYHVYKKLKRLEKPLMRRDGELKRVNWRRAYRHLFERFQSFKPEEIAAVGSGYATNEENFMLQKLFRDGLKCANVAIDDRFPSEEDVVYPRFIIKGEKLPNYRGASDMLQPASTFSQLLKEIDAGKIKALYWLDGSPQFVLTEEEIQVLKKLDFLVVQHIAHTPVTEMAHIVFPGASAYEKTGSFTNYQGRVQRIQRALLPPGAAKSDFEIFQEMLDLLDIATYLNLQEVFSEISETRSAYAGLSWEQMGELGANTAVGEEAAVSSSSSS